MQPSLNVPPIEHLAIIAEALKAHPLCEQILRFLVDNENALDTARGIAAWWVHSDEIAVTDALDRLVSCGVIAIYPFRSGMLYGLTRNPETRTWLRDSFSTVPMISLGEAEASDNP